MRLVHPSPPHSPRPTRAASLRRAIARLAQRPLWALLAWIAGRRRWRIDPGALHAADFPAQSRGRGWRMTEPLRDLLRPGWLRLRRSDRDS